MTGRRILVVDDDRRILRTVKRTLQEAGYAVHTTHVPSKAVPLAARIRPALAILDIMMPGMTGFDVAEDLHSNRATAKIPCMFLTARETSQNIEQARAVGAHAYLEKPFRKDTLLSLVARILSADGP